MTSSSADGPLPFSALDFALFAAVGGPLLLLGGGVGRLARVRVNADDDRPSRTFAAPGTRGCAGRTGRAPFARPACADGSPGSGLAAVARGPSPAFARCVDAPHRRSRDDLRLERGRAARSATDLARRLLRFRPRVRRVPGPLRHAPSLRAPRGAARGPRRASLASVPVLLLRGLFSDPGRPLAPGDPRLGLRSRLPRRRPRRAPLVTHAGVPQRRVVPPDADHRRGQGRQARGCAAPVAAPARAQADRLPGQGAAARRGRLPSASGPRCQLGPRPDRGAVRRRAGRDHLLPRAPRGAAPAREALRGARHPGRVRAAAVREDDEPADDRALRRPPAHLGALSESEGPPVRGQVRGRPRRRARPAPARPACDDPGRDRRPAGHGPSALLPPGPRRTRRPDIRDAQVPDDAPRRDRHRPRIRSTSRRTRPRAESRAATGARSSARSCARPRSTSCRS